MRYMVTKLAGCLSQGSIPTATRLGGSATCGLVAVASRECRLKRTEKKEREREREGEGERERKE